MQGRPTPAATFDFERRLALLVRECGRAAVEATYNQLEPDEPQDAPHYVEHSAGEYRRISQKTPRRDVATRFGKITLWRRGYRFVNRDVAERTIFPLELALGLTAGATPALAEVAVRNMAEAGATQGAVLARLRDEHGVNWSPRTLRAVTEEIEARLTPLRRGLQVAQAVRWLELAEKSRGKQRPTLSVGRDGVTLATRPHGFFEVATAATLTVYDRAGKRLGSLYLGYVPELGQHTMTEELTALLKEILTAWSGKLPRLVYLTDAGESECAYFADVLRRLRHPTTGRRLCWQRIIDYYHAAARLTTMADAMFGAGSPAANAWARRMRKLLKKPSGVFRVLHSAAALRCRGGMSAARRKLFQTAYQYLRKRSRHLRYHEYQSAKLPIGSGVTEAACKTLFTQRLKLSGMRWSREGAQRILNLRAIRLSGIWHDTYRAMLASYTFPTLRTPAHPRRPAQRLAA